LAVSPDGKQIAFNSTKSGTTNVWVVPVDGGEPRQLTFDSEAMGWQSWSPDGKLIAIETKRGEDTHLMIMPADGGAPTQLTFDRGQSWPHDWSPDGDKIVFAGQRNDLWNIYWVSRSTKMQKQITSNSKLNTYMRYPAWSPLGDKLAYEYSETTGNIWLMELK
jgi:TolB protein